MLIHTSNSLAYEQIQLNSFITAEEKNSSRSTALRTPASLLLAECQSCLDTEPNCTDTVSNLCLGLWVIADRNMH